MGWEVGGEGVVEGRAKWGVRVCRSRVETQLSMHFLESKMLRKFSLNNEKRIEIKCEEVICSNPDETGGGARVYSGWRLCVTEDQARDREGCRKNSVCIAQLSPLLPVGLQGPTGRWKCSPCAPPSHQFVRENVSGQGFLQRLDVELLPQAEVSTVAWTRMEKQYRDRKVGWGFLCCFFPVASGKFTQKLRVVATCDPK